MIALDIKIWVALIAALASLVVAAINFLSGKSTQRAIEDLRHRYAEQRAERDAKRDYEYEARKRLYHECGPLLFQLAELSEAAFHRITGLARTARDGNLEPGPRSHLRDEYYRVSTLYRLLAPVAVLKLMQRRLTLLDLSLDATLFRQYTLLRQAFFAFGDELAFARMGNHSLDYRPLEPEAVRQYRNNPAVFWRQGLPLGVMEGSIEALLVVQADNQPRVMTYAECELEYAKPTSRLKEAFDGIAFLIEDFHPATRPVLWRMLVTQAHIYKALFDPAPQASVEWTVDELKMRSQDRGLFDWRSHERQSTKDADVFDPLTVADTYLQERLVPRMVRLNLASRRDSSEA